MRARITLFGPSDDEAEQLVIVTVDGVSVSCKPALLSKLASALIAADWEWRREDRPRPPVIHEVTLEL